MRLKNLPPFFINMQEWLGTNLVFGLRFGLFSSNRSLRSLSSSSPTPLSPAQLAQYPCMAYGCIGRSWSSGRERLELMMASFVPQSEQTNLPLSGTLP